MISEKEFFSFIDGKPLEEILNNPLIAGRFTEAGSDINIVNYIFNYKKPDGTINSSLNNLNAFTNFLYKTFFSIQDKAPITDQYEIILTKTTFTKESYGNDFVRNYAIRCGITDYDQVPDYQKNINCLRSTIMDPMLIEFGDPTSTYNFYKEKLIPGIKLILNNAINDLWNNKINLSF